MISFEHSGPRQQRPLTGIPIQEWISPDGTLWGQCFKLRSSYLIRYPEVADYEIASDGSEVICHPVTGAESAATEHHYLNQVLPLARSRQGLLTFHGSAVDVGDGAIAFLGEAGRGKSTLAASFASNGFPFLGDDTLQLSRKGAGYDVLPCHPSCRLWRDSSTALALSEQERAPGLSFTEKERIIAGDTLRHSDHGARLKAAFILGTGAAPTITIRPRRPGDALISLVKHTFLLDAGDRVLIQGHFDATADLVSAIPCFDLDYPRIYRLLPELRDAILSEMTGVFD